MKLTPLHEIHVKLGARMAPFGGWDMPIQYKGILAEHEQTRKRASVFDTCHMGEFELRGPSAERDLERLLTQSIATIPQSRCRYGYLLRDDGGVLDDLTCYRMGPDHFMLVVNAGTLDRDAEWIRGHLSSGTTFTDLSPRTAKLDIQGPRSREEMERAFRARLPELKYFGFDHVTLDGASCLVSRTGYTGEWGYEIYFPEDKAIRFWELLTAGGGVQPAGLGARDTLRLEMGYALYGHELTEDRTPVGAGRGRYMDLKKDFIGRAAVEAELARGDGLVLAGLRLETRRAARAGEVVWAAGKPVGQVTSGSVAPSLGVAVAMAYVDKAHGDPGTIVEIESRGARLPARVVELPFYPNGSARGLPPA